MSLTKELKMMSLVLLSKRPDFFDPADYSQYWLDQKNVIPASSVSKQSSFSPLASQVLSDKLNLIVTQEQIQIAPSDASSFKEVISERSVALVKEMPKCELNGMGLNFHWFLSDDKKSYAELSRKYFYNENNPANKFFDDGNEMFGSYLSKDLSKDMRLKLDIKPAILYDIKTSSASEKIQFGFNFHSDLNTENQREKLIEILSAYDKWYKTSEEIINAFQ